MMKRLIIICALAVPILTAGAQAGIVNGSFEAGLNDWSIIVPSGASVSVVLSHSDPGGAGTTSWGPTDGSSLAVLKTDGPGSQTMLYQSFYATAGTTLSFDYFWDSQDFFSFDDMGMGMLIAGIGTGGPVISTLFSHNVNSDPADYWGTPWTTVSYTFGTSGAYTLLITNTNGGDSILDSYVGIDNVNIIPTPGAILLGSIGIGIVGWLRRRRTL